MIGPPTATDDSTKGFSKGHRWFDEIGTDGEPDYYVCFDNTEGAAVWRRQPVCNQTGKVHVNHLPNEVTSLIGGGGGGGGNIDGGNASSVYAPGQSIDGGSA